MLLPTPTRHRILLLEDHDALAASLASVLGLAGHTVTRFRSLDEARHAIPPIGFDVLLCDHDLPDGTGLTFLTEVEDSSPLGLAKWTTILFSGTDRGRELRESGLTVDHVLLKSVGAVDELLAILADA